MAHRIYVLGCAGALADALRESAGAAGLRVIDVRVDEDHAEVDAEGDGSPDWGCEILDVVDVGSLEGSADPLGRALGLMARGRFWEAHEVLEPAWRASSGRPRELLGLLVRCCAAAVHAQRGRPDSAASIAARALAAADPSIVPALRRECESAGAAAALRAFARGALESRALDELPIRKARAPTIGFSSSLDR
ncbi:MAG: DUF309 domain-containing protein [Conexivisphaera sp.]